jgi:hypothetical protein
MCRTYGSHFIFMRLINGLKPPVRTGLQYGSMLRIYIIKLLFFSNYSIVFFATVIVSPFCYHLFFLLSRLPIFKSKAFILYN